MAPPTTAFANLLHAAVTEPGIIRTQSGGTPYGASQYSGWEGDRELDSTESELCRALGRRVAGIALKLRD